jgi:hypothetical protein
MPEHLTKEAFAEQLNTKFYIHLTPEKTAETELVEVRELKTGPRQEVFSILFLAPPDFPIEQRMYVLEHPQLGAFELFLVPVGKDDQGIKCEAVFNRLID